MFASPKTTTATAAVVLTISLFACVKDDPIVAGKRDAAPPPTPPSLVVPAADHPDVDDPNCSTCSSTLDTTSARGLLCRKNKPRSSAIILNELVSCVCNDKCVDQCANYCSGATPEAACFPCIIAGCSELLNECTGDTPTK